MAGIKDAPQPCGLYEIGAHVAVPNILWSSDWSVAPGPMLRTTITFSSTNCSQDTCVPMKVGGSACRATRPLPRGPKGSDGIPANWTVEVPTHWGLTCRQHRRPGPPSGNAGQYLPPRRARTTPEEHQRAGDPADELFREIKRRRETMAEDPLLEAQIHVTEGERRVAEQIDLIARMKADGDSEQTIAAAEAALETLRQTLQPVREYLEREQQRASETPPD